jgi:hypothetical protein
MDCSEEYLQHALSASTVLSMTVCFVPTTRFAEIRYQDADGRLSSTLEETDGSFNHWYGRGGSENHLGVHPTDEEAACASLNAFAMTLYELARDENDRRDRRFRRDPRLLSFTIDFTKGARVAEIAYLERDGRITTATEFVIDRVFHIQYSHGGWHRVKRAPATPDFSPLRTYAKNLYAVAMREFFERAEFERLYEGAF